MSFRRLTDYITSIAVVTIVILAGTIGFLYGSSYNPRTQTITINQTTTKTIVETQKINQTTITSTIKSTITSTITVTTTSASTVTPTNMTSGSFTYSPSSPLKIQSVQAIVSRAENGDRYVTFTVELKNTSNSTIYIVGGCGSGLYLSTPADSAVLQEISSGPVCLCPEFIMPLYQGQNHTSTVPGCWSGYAVKLLSSGMVTVNLTQYWSTESSGAQNENHTSITASFTFTFNN